MKRRLIVASLAVLLVYLVGITIFGTLFRKSHQTLLIAQHDGDDGHKAELFDDSLQPMALQDMIQLVAEHAGHFFSAPAGTDQCN